GAGEGGARHVVARWDHREVAVELVGDEAVRRVLRCDDVHVRVPYHLVVARKGELEAGGHVHHRGHDGRDLGGRRRRARGPVETGAEEGLEARGGAARVHRLIAPVTGGGEGARVAEDGEHVVLEADRGGI